MRKITLAALAFAGAAALAGVTAVPAFAADDTTPVTVTVSAGALSINAPASESLWEDTPGTSVVTMMQPTVVSDKRSGTAGWVVTVTLPVLTGTATSGNATIATTGAGYEAQNADTTGTVWVTKAASFTNLTTAKTIQTATGVSGNNGATWYGALTIPVPADALADTYSGTLTLSVT